MKEVKSNTKAKQVEKLFQEVREEVNEDEIKAAKLKIKDLLKQKSAAEKVVKNIDRQIDDLKLKIEGELL